MVRITVNGSPSKSDVLFTGEEWVTLIKDLRLSPREGQILEMMCEGLKDETVAQRLDMSVHTVRSHIGRLHRKLDVSNRAALLVLIFKAHRRLARDQGEKLDPPVIQVVKRHMLTHVRNGVS